MSKPDQLIIDGVSIRVETEMHGLREEWANFEKSAICSLFQNFDWNYEWYKTFAKPKNIQALIVIGYDINHNLQFILPLQIRRKMGAKTLEWLAQPESSYGIGLYEKSFQQQHGPHWFGQYLPRILELLPQFDVLNLQNMPLAYESFANPLTQLRLFEGANCTYVTNLISDYDTLLQSKRGPSSLKSMRKRDRRLDELGEVQFRQESVKSENLQLILKSKEQQLASQGIFNVFDAPMPDFLLAASQSNTAQFIIFDLLLDGKILSSMFTAVHRECFYPLIITLNEAGPLQVSPGDILLRHSIKWACENGIKKVDFSMGSASFKQIWADETVVLYNHFAARSLRGLPLAISLMCFNQVKRLIKKSTFAKDQFSKIRQKLFGKSLKR
jgi:CelD/BcsL family acetyltransferase involved in cellulose biosynthesis